MKIRVLSDLHLDVNEKHCFKIPKKTQDVFTVIAGDTSGDPRETIEWINKNIKRGILISGNHLVYNRRKLPIQKLRDELHEAFPVDGDVTYLDAECGVVSKEVDGILFIGTCMYTNMTYSNCDATVDINCYLSKKYMNDFRWGRVAENVFMSPEDYIKWFNHAFEMIDKIVCENEASADPKPIVLLTHHGLSKECISSHYTNSDLNCAYITDKDEWLMKHSSIKACIYGHVHEIDDMKKVLEIYRDDGSRLLLLNNSRGYCSRAEDQYFKPEMTIDTDTWKVTMPELSKSQKAKLDKRVAEHSEKLTRCLAWGIF